MQITPDLAAFLASPVMIIVGTSDAERQSGIGRGMGASVDPGNGIVEVVLSGWQWPGTVASVRATGRIAMTFARPMDYVCYQVKGRATLREPEPMDLARSSSYMASIAEVLVGQGLERHLIAPWLTNQEPIVVRVDVEAVFVQTPGSKAGQPLSSSP